LQSIHFSEKAAELSMGRNDKVRAKTATVENRGPIELGILIYPGALMSAVLGLTDLFGVANRLSEERVGAGAKQLRVSHWQLSAENGTELERIFDTHQQQPNKLVGLILPPNLDIDPQGAAIAKVQQWVETQHAAGCLICSICGGAFMLAKTGLLNGRAATTHWTFAETFADRFPQIQVQTEKLVIDDGDIITAGGVMAWVDMGLKLVDRFIGPTIMLETARFFLVDAAGRQQRFYSNFSPRLNHGDNSILRVQQWLQSSDVSRVSVPMMAAKARMGERTFLRCFEKATGLTPTKYVQHLRVGKAREELEFSSLAIKEIGWKVGYEDYGAFRKVFQKIMGLSPRDYRLRFAVQPREISH
jgi:transcriptional regulator GlxA family with amidase domain